MQDTSSSDIDRLFPPPAQSRQLEGLYLEQDIRAYANERTQPLLYANFVTSLDGRIAIPDRAGGGLKVPGEVANDRDWRLFQELAAQADIIITTGRYLRDYAAGKAQEILRTEDNAANADLAEWRKARNLPAQPDLVVVSSSLDFPIPEALREQERKVLVVTDRRAEAEKVESIERQLGEVVVVDSPEGEDGVEGSSLVETLATRGYRAVYSAAGPRILHMLLAANVLDRLYLTMVPRVLGGDPFATIVDGPLLDEPVDMALQTLYHDTSAKDGLGQFFACYEKAK